MFKLNDRVAIRVDGKDVIGRLIGIDLYELENFSGSTSAWPSYTLVSDKKGLFSRYWFVLWDKSKWILWTKAKNKALPGNAKLIPGKSGIAKIDFSGDAGLSTPVAALAQYAVGKKYFCLERFAGSSTMVFSGRKISKPAVIPKTKKK